MTDLSFLPERPARAPGGLLDRMTPKGVHQMRDAFDIGEALSALADSGSLLTIYPAANAMPRQARIASVDPEQPHFVLDLPGAPMAPGRATFVAALDNDAMLQFDLDADWTALPGQPQLVPAHFPASCLVQERRTNTRAGTPMVGNYHARFALNGREIELPLCDYSTGGIGMHASLALAAHFAIGMKLKDVQLQLGRALAIRTDLEIRLLRPFHSYLLGEQMQIGCSFDQNSRGQV